MAQDEYQPDTIPIPRVADRELAQTVRRYEKGIYGQAEKKFKFSDFVKRTRYNFISSFYKTERSVYTQILPNSIPDISDFSQQLASEGGFSFSSFLLSSGLRGVTSQSAADAIKQGILPSNYALRTATAGATLGLLKFHRGEHLTYMRKMLSLAYEQTQTQREMLLTLKGLGLSGGAGGSGGYSGGLFSYVHESLKRQTASVIASTLRQMMRDSVINGALWLYTRSHLKDVLAGDMNISTSAKLLKSHFARHGLTRWAAGMWDWRMFRPHAFLNRSLLSLGRKIESYHVNSPIMRLGKYLTRTWVTNANSLNPYTGLDGTNDTISSLGGGIGGEFTKKSLFYQKSSLKYLEEIRNILYGLSSLPRYGTELGVSSSIPLSPSLSLPRYGTEEEYLVEQERIRLNKKIEKEKEKERRLRGLEEKAAELEDGNNYIEYLKDRYAKRHTLWEKLKLFWKERSESIERKKEQAAGEWFQKVGIKSKLSEDRLKGLGLTALMALSPIAVPFLGALPTTLTLGGTLGYQMLHRSFSQKRKMQTPWLRALQTGALSLASVGMLGPWAAALTLPFGLAGGIGSLKNKSIQEKNNFYRWINDINMISQDFMNSQLIPFHFLKPLGVLPGLVSAGKLTSAWVNRYNKRMHFYDRVLKKNKSEEEYRELAREHYYFKPGDDDLTIERGIERYKKDEDKILLDALRKKEAMMARREAMGENRFLSFLKQTIPGYLSKEEKEKLREENNLKTVGFFDMFRPSKKYWERNMGMSFWEGVSAPFSKAGREKLKENWNNKDLHWFNYGDVFRGMASNFGLLKSQKAAKKLDNNTLSFMADYDAFRQLTKEAKNPNLSPEVRAQYADQARDLLLSLQARGKEREELYGQAWLQGAGGLEEGEIRERQNRKITRLNAILQKIDPNSNLSKILDSSSQSPVKNLNLSESPTTVTVGGNIPSFSPANMDVKAGVVNIYTGKIGFMEGGGGSTPPETPKSPSSSFSSYDAKVQKMYGYNPKPVESVVNPASNISTETPEEEDKKRQAEIHPDKSNFKVLPLGHQTVHYNLPQMDHSTSHQGWKDWLEGKAEEGLGVIGGYELVKKIIPGSVKEVEKVGTQEAEKVLRNMYPYGHYVTVPTSSSIVKGVEKEIPKGVEEYAKMSKWSMLKQALKSATKPFGVLKSLSKLRLPGRAGKVLTLSLGALAALAGTAWGESQFHHLEDGTESESWLSPKHLLEGIGGTLGALSLYHGVKKYRELSGLKKAAEETLASAALKEGEAPLPKKAPFTVLGALGKGAFNIGKLGVKPTLALGKLGLKALNLPFYLVPKKFRTLTKIGAGLWTAHHFWDEYENRPTTQKNISPDPNAPLYVRWGTVESGESLPHPKPPPVQKAPVEEKSQWEQEGWLGKGWDLTKLAIAAHLGHKLLSTGVKRRALEAGYEAAKAEGRSKLGNLLYDVVTLGRRHRLAGSHLHDLKGFNGKEAAAAFKEGYELKDSNAIAKALRYGRGTRLLTKIFDPVTIANEVASHYVTDKALQATLATGNDNVGTVSSFFGPELYASLAGVRNTIKDWLDPHRVTTHNLKDRLANTAIMAGEDGALGSTVGSVVGLGVADWATVPIGTAIGALVGALSANTDELKKGWKSLKHGLKEGYDYVGEKLSSWGGDLKGIGEMVCTWATTSLVQDAKKQVSSQGLIPRAVKWLAKKGKKLYNNFSFSSIISQIPVLSGVAGLASEGWSWWNKFRNSVAQDAPEVGGGWRSWIGNILREAPGAMPTFTPVARPITKAEEKKNTVDGMKYLMKEGFSENAAAALIGNFIQESSLNPHAVGDGGSAYGIAQWHPWRQGNIERHFKKSLAKMDFLGQLKASLWEMKKYYPDCYAAMRKKGLKVKDYVYHLVYDYEMPADKPDNVVYRTDNAYGVLKLMKTQHIKLPTPANTETPLPSLGPKGGSSSAPPVSSKPVSTLHPAVDETKVEESTQPSPKTNKLSGQALAHALVLKKHIQENQSDTGLTKKDIQEAVQAGTQHIATAINTHRQETVKTNKVLSDVNTVLKSPPTKDKQEGNVTIINSSPITSVTHFAPHPQQELSIKKQRIGRL